MPKYQYSREFETAVLKALHLEDKANSINRIIIDLQAHSPVTVYVKMYPDLEAPEELTSVLALLLESKLTDPPSIETTPQSEDSN